MKIHHLNCGTCCPVGGRLFDGTSDSVVGHLVCHCLLIETDAGLVLIDTGFGTRDVDHPGARLSPFFRALNNPQLREHETAAAQVRGQEGSAEPQRLVEIDLGRLGRAAAAWPAPAAASATALRPSIAAAAHRKCRLWAT